MTKLNTIKLVTRIVVGICTSATVGQALRNNVPTETKIQKIEVAVGSAVVGARPTARRSRSRSCACGCTGRSCP